MAGLCDYPGAHVMDRVATVEKALQYLAESTAAFEWVERKEPGSLSLSAEALEGLAGLLNACAETLEDIIKTN